MSITYGFFNSVNGDRVYNADDFNSCIDAIASDGIFKRNGGSLQVGVNTGMSLQVLDGYARFKGYWIKNDAVINLTIPAADTQNPRIDAVVVRVDTSARTVTIAVKQGTAAATPAAPEMTRSATINEYCLATVAVAANTTAMSQSYITDTRGDASVCGWVKCGTPARYTNSATISASTTAIPIGIDEYSSGDLLDVYRGGMYLANGIDYTDNRDGTITFTSAISSGTIVFVVTKMVF